MHKPSFLSNREFLSLLWVNASCCVVTMNKYNNPLFVTMFQCCERRIVVLFIVTCYEQRIVVLIQGIFNYFL
jgi:hypothetical protein